MEEVIEYDDYSHTMSRSRTYEDYSRTMSGVRPGSARAARLSDVIYDSVRQFPVVSSGGRDMQPHASRAPVAAGMREFQSPAQRPSVAAASIRQRTSDPRQRQSTQDSQQHRGRRGGRRSSVDSDDSDQSISDLNLHSNDRDDHHYEGDSRRGGGGGDNRNALRGAGASFTREFEC